MVVHISEFGPDWRRAIVTNVAEIKFITLLIKRVVGFVPIRVCASQQSGVPIIEDGIPRFLGELCKKYYAIVNYMKKVKI